MLNKLQEEKRKGGERGINKGEGEREREGEK